VPLSVLDTGASAVVVAVLLTFLDGIGLRPGATVCVMQRDQIVALMTVAIDNIERIVSFQLANSILTSRA
jgi:hypothetical protein